MLLYNLILMCDVLYKYSLISLRLIKDFSKYYVYWLNVFLLKCFMTSLNVLIVHFNTEFTSLIQIKPIPIFYYKTKVTKYDIIKTVFVWFLFYNIWFQSKTEIKSKIMKDNKICVEKE